LFDSDLQLKQSKYDEHVIDNILINKF